MPQQPIEKRSALSRRAWLASAGGGIAGAMTTALAAPASESAALPPPRHPIRSCILVFHYGGPSHLDTFDPKPQAPEGIRGEYRTISTSVPGVAVTEHLPQVAGVMHRMALIRSMHHRMSNHNSAAAEGLTGRTPTGGDQELLADEARGFPTLGSAVAYGLGSAAHVLPYVALPYTIQNVVQIPGQTAGFLGGAFDRFQVNGDPGRDDFRIAALELPGDRSTDNVLARDRLLKSLGEQTAFPSAARMNALRERVFGLLTSDSVRKAFRMSEEPLPLRERYGKTLLGQSLLLARRLVESGVNFVTVFDGHSNGQDANWDSHQTIFPRHKQLIPPADQGLSALIEDLELRGLLDSTLIVAMGEFGRTPRINAQAGRDHWPYCYTAALAGGGVQGGAVYGASDPTGSTPARDPVTPGQLATTILWRFGIDPHLHVYDQTRRPFRLGEGEPLTGLFA